MTKEIQIGLLASKLGLKLDQLVRGVIVDLFNGVILDTRVETGRMRGNWQTNIGEPISSETTRLDKITQHERGGGAMDDVAAKVEPGKVNYLSNNIHYVQKWEDVDGMISKNVVRVERNIDLKIKELNR